MTTLHERIAQARDALAAAGIARDEAALDAELLARYALGWDQARLILSRLQKLPDGFEEKYAPLVARRASREPASQILGTREFWGLDFHVTPAVLIPRPETEFVVEEALERLRPLHGARLADVGTGSGCIAVALAHELPDCHVVATDVSSDALVVARANAETHGVAGRIEFIAASYLGGVEGDFDLIAANPPYVRDRDKPALAPDVRHEPDVALFGGETGLRDVEAVLDTAIAKLRRSGWLVMEFGFGQDDAVEALVRAREDLQLVRIRQDLQGIPRTAIIQRR